MTRVRQLCDTSADSRADSSAIPFLVIFPIEDSSAARQRTPPRTALHRDKSARAHGTSAGGDTSAALGLQLERATLERATLERAMAVRALYLLLAGLSIRGAHFSHACPQSCHDSSADTSVC